MSIAEFITAVEQVEHVQQVLDSNTQIEIQIAPLPETQEHAIKREVHKIATEHAVHLERYMFTV